MSASIRKNSTLLVDIQNGSAAVVRLWTFLEKLSTDLQDPAVHILGIFPEELKTGTVNLCVCVYSTCTHVHCSTIHNCQNVETMYITEEWIWSMKCYLATKRNKVLTYTCCNADEPWKQAKWKKPDKNRFTYSKWEMKRNQTIRMQNREIKKPREEAKGRKNHPFCYTLLSS